MRTVERFIQSQADDGFSYSEIGRTENNIPAGFNVDHNRVKIGSGVEAFVRAKSAVRGWKMFEMPWVQLVKDDTPLEPGNTVAIVVKHFGFYSLNAARIVYLIDEAGDIERFGFAYGTLGEHAEMGEERFSVEYHRATDEVWYDLLAFSRPGSMSAVFGYPLGRYLQKTFARDSKLAMFRAVCEGSDQPSIGKIVLE